MNAKLRNLAVLVALLACAAVATGWINVNFPPTLLVKQSQFVLHLEFTGVDKDGKATAKVVEVLKGQHDKKLLMVDLMAGASEEQGKAVAARIGQGEKQAMLFVGIYEEGGGEGGPAAGQGPKGFLHIAGPISGSQWQWASLNQSQGDVWEMEGLDEHMLGTFAGGTRELLRCVKYILTDPGAEVPVDEGVSWNKEKQAQIGKVEGKIAAAAPVDLQGKGRTDLFLACDKGDRVFRFNGKEFEDLTSKLALASKSLVFAWGDFNGDGRLDLASWDGKQLTIHSQQADGTFKAADCKAGEALKDGCLDLTTVDTGNKGRPALVAGTRAAPVLLVVQDDGTVQGKALATGEFPGKDLGEAGRCLVADFDDDALPDILQFFVSGGLFYKGKGPGEFAAPAKTRIMSGRGRYGACLGDFDADGLLDIFTAGEEWNFIWHNLGGGKFVETLDISGEIGYHPKPGGIFTQAGDFNNDGRQDVLVVYGEQMFPQLFYNRGFRSFGQAMMLDLAEQHLLPESSQGQQAGCLGDLNGDGAQDLVIVLQSGEVWFLPRKIVGKALAVSAAFSLASPNAGPINVLGWRDERPLGAWPVRAGEVGAFFGARDAGPITLKWRLPGGKWEQKEVVVEDKAVRAVLDKK